MSQRKRTIQGVVVSNATDKTIVVETSRHVPHRLYKKSVLVRKRHMAHDPKNECAIGDEVILTESRPLSARKRWRLHEILVKSQIQPDEEAASLDSAAV